jgi:hypothetical protein
MSLDNAEVRSQHNRIDSKPSAKLPTGRDRKMSFLGFIFMFLMIDTNSLQEIGRQNRGPVGRDIAERFGISAVRL